MTRVSVYSAAFVALVAATAMTIASIFLPNWLSWDVTTPSGDHIHHSYGLHRQCSSLRTENCRPYPTREDCSGPDRYFCSMWRSVGFMMSWAAVMELVAIVSFLVVMIGGRQKRETGWKLLGFLLAVVVALQCASMAIVAYLYDNDDRFFVGWTFDKSWIMCTVSWSVIALSAAGLVASAFIFDSEGGYELIPSERNYNAIPYEQVSREDD